MMQLPSFILPANDGRASTPDGAARRRSMAQNMLYSGMDTSPIASPWQGASRIAQALVGGYGMRKADQAEAEGREGANALMAKLLQGGDSPDNATIMEAMNNPWLSEGQGRLAAGLLEQNFKKSQPDWQTFTDKNTGDVYRYNGNDPSSKPEVFFDAPAAPQDLMNVPKGGALYDPNTKSWVTPPSAQGGASMADIDDVTKIVKMYDQAPGVSRYREIVPSLKSMQESLKDNSTISDLDFVYGVAKVLDPESVVRESEGQAVIASQSLPDQVVGQFNRILRGEQALTAKVRKDLYRLARRRGEQLRQQAQDEANYFHEFGAGYGVAPQQFRPVDALPEYNEAMYPDQTGAPHRVGRAPVMNFQTSPPPPASVLRQKYGIQ